MSQPEKKTAIQKPAEPNRQVVVLADIIAQKRDALAAVAAANLDADRLVKLAQAAVSRSPDLARCTPLSVITALMRCSELGLEPNATLAQRRMWLVPRWNSKLSALECIAQIDYRAEIQLARDTGLVLDVVAEDVRANDAFTLERGAAGTSLTKFSHRPVIFGDRGDVIGFYAAARLEGGAVPFYAMTAAEVEAFRDHYAPTDKTGKIVGPWGSPRENERNAMAKKTCLHRLWNLLPAGKSEAARRLQERLAEETEQDLGQIAVETTAAPPGNGGGRTAAVKERLAAKLGKAPATDTAGLDREFAEQSGEPEPTPPEDMEPGAEG